MVTSERSVHRFAATIRGWGGRALVVVSLCSVAVVGACQRGESGDSSSAPHAVDGEADASGPEASATARSELDEAIAAMWTKAGVEPAATIDDAGYYRRVSLDLRGRIPTPQEARAFAADARPDKRARTVDEILASDEYAAYWSEVYAGLLLGDDNVQQKSRRAFEAWLEAEIGEGTGWDTLARAMVTAQGDLTKQPEGVFIASHLRQSGPELLTGSLTRRMLGVQIECAQCHDHPYSDFTQQDFYGMAAFFARTKVQRTDKVKAKAKPDMNDMEAMAKPAAKNKGRTFVLAERERGELRIKPKDAQGNELDRKVKVAPSFLGAETKVAPTDMRRTVFAESMIDSDLFSQAAVGFVWSELFGRGIADPWDELGDSDQARPPALTLLSEQFESKDYDLRWLLRTIVLSEAYQRDAAGPQLEVTEREKAERVFARAAVRPLRSAQLFRSLLEATGLEDVGGKAFRQAVKNKKQQALKEYEFIFMDDEAQHIDAFSGNVPQALLLLNGGLTNQGVAQRKGSAVAEILALEGFDARLEALYLRAYGRTPSEAEASQARAWVQGQGAEAWEDLLFAMLNTTEFTTNH